MTWYTFLPEGTTEVALVPGVTEDTAVTDAQDSFPQGGVLLLDGKFLRNVPAKRGVVEVAEIDDFRNK